MVNRHQYSPLKNKLFALLSKLLLRYHNCIIGHKALCNTVIYKLVIEKDLLIIMFFKKKLFKRFTILNI